MAVNWTTRKIATLLLAAVCVLISIYYFEKSLRPYDPIREHWKLAEKNAKSKFPPGTLVSVFKDGMLKDGFRKLDSNAVNRLYFRQDFDFEFNGRPNHSHVMICADYKDEEIVSVFLCSIPDSPSTRRH